MDLLQIHDCVLHARKLVDKIDSSLSGSEYSGRTYPQSDDEASTSGYRKYQPYQQSYETASSKYETNPDRALSSTSTYVRFNSGLEEPARRPVQLKTVEEQEQEYRDLLTTAYDTFSDVNIPPVNAAANTSRSPSPTLSRYAQYPGYSEYRPSNYPCYSKAIPDPSLDVTEDEHGYVYEVMDASASDDDSMKNCYCEELLTNSVLTASNIATSNTYPSYSEGNPEYSLYGMRDPCNLNRCSFRQTTDLGRFGYIECGSSTYQTSSERVTEYTLDIHGSLEQYATQVCAQNTQDSVSEYPRLNHVQSDSINTTCPSSSEQISEYLSPEMKKILSDYKNKDPSRETSLYNPSDHVPSSLSSSDKLSENLSLKIRDVFDKYVTEICAKNKCPFGKNSNQKQFEQSPCDFRDTQPRRSPDINDILNKYKTDVGAKNQCPFSNTSNQGVGGPSAATDTQPSASRNTGKQSPDISDILDKYKADDCARNKCPLGKSNQQSSPCGSKETQPGKYPSDISDVVNKYKTDVCAKNACPFGKTSNQEGVDSSPCGLTNTQSNDSRETGKQSSNISGILNKYITNDCARNKCPVGTISNQEDIDSSPCGRKTPGRAQEVKNNFDKDKSDKYAASRIPTLGVKKPDNGQSDSKGLQDLKKSDNKMLKKYAPPAATTVKGASASDGFGTKQSGTDLIHCTNPYCRNSPLSTFPSSPVTTGRLETYKPPGKAAALSKRPYTSPHPNRTTGKLCNPNCTISPSTCIESNSPETLYQTAKQLRNVYLPYVSKYNTMREDIYKSKYCIGLCHCSKIPKMTKHKNEAHSKIEEKDNTEIPSGSK